MSATRWLVDKSALRPHVPAFAESLLPKIAAGRVHVCVVTELEVGFSVRSSSDLDRVKTDVLGPLIRVVMPVAAEHRAREVQAALTLRGQHRAVAVPDLLVAAIAEIEGPDDPAPRRRLRPDRRRDGPTRRVGRGRAAPVTWAG